MKLKAYLKSERETAERFAWRIPVSVSAVGKWVRGERMPSPANMAKIAEATTYRVTADDFHDMPEREQAS